MSCLLRSLSLTKGISTKGYSIRDAGGNLDTRLRQDCAPASCAPPGVRNLIVIDYDDTLLPSSVRGGDPLEPKSWAHLGTLGERASWYSCDGDIRSGSGAVLVCYVLSLPMLEVHLDE